MSPEDFRERLDEIGRLSSHEIGGILAVSDLLDFTPDQLAEIYATKLRVQRDEQQKRWR